MHIIQALLSYVSLNIDHSINSYQLSTKRKATLQISLNCGNYMEYGCIHVRFITNRKCFPSIQRKKVKQKRERSTKMHRYDVRNAFYMITKMQFFFVSCFFLLGKESEVFQPISCSCFNVESQQGNDFQCRKFAVNFFFRKWWSNGINNQLWIVTHIEKKIE